MTPGTVAFDTETTGVDFGHGAMPFFVTTFTEAGGVRYWEWYVDPFTRRPEVPAADLDEVFAELTAAPRLLAQNAKFDVRALNTLRQGVAASWDWGRTDDTLLAAHLVSSNQPKSLDALALRWLGIDLTRYEKALEDAVQACRRLCRQKAFQDRHGVWAIAGQGRPDMPSCGEKAWRFDYWLPRAVVKAEWEASEAGKIWVGERPSWEKGTTDDSSIFHRLLKRDRVSERCRTAGGWEFRPPGVGLNVDGEGDGHPWWTVLPDYANADPEATWFIWKRLWAEMESRSLLPQYRQRLRVLRVTAEMERRGVTVRADHLDDLCGEFQADRASAAARCVGIAGSLGYALELPRGASPNRSLRTFMLDTLGLEPRYGKKSKTAEPTLDKEAMAHYSATLPPASKAGSFVRNLLHKRKRDTAVAYMDGYRKFWSATDWPHVSRLFPSFNMTGTDTLRFSCSNPNAQNISKQETDCRACRGEGEGDAGVCGYCGGSGKDLRSVRYCFGPAPGREWWSMDAKNIELRIPFYKSGDPDLIGLFERPDDPPFYGSNHILNFSVVYPDIWADAVREVGLDKAGPYCKKRYASTWYQWCKNGGFAIQYQAGDATADAAFHKPGARRLLKQKFARLDALNDEQLRKAARLGYVETVPDRDVDPTRGYPLLCTRTENGGILPTVPLSYYIQGTAMQWTAKAMVRCAEALDGWRAGGYDGFITMQVHDEIVFDLPRRSHPVKNPKASNLPRVRVLKRLMEQGGDDIGVPTPVGCEYHESNWAEGVTVSV